MANLDRMIESARRAMDVDYELMVDQAEHLIATLARAVSVRVTTPGGTDITLDIRGRRAITDVKITETEKPD